MKWFFKIIVLSILLQSFQCTDPNDSSENITSEELEIKKQEIQNYINSFSCSESVGCGFIAFGTKPCGGPWSYLLFSNAVDIVKLQEMVKNYNEMNKQYNLKTDAVSDCMYQIPPTEVKCVNGVCTIIK
ncbi:hypothetical protein [Flavobacterium sp.]|uniref:hypothetical protein n=1 Tax=Flavobacterium sp. TaxID=239 RepID=UPI0038FCC473